ncbi:MAG: NAD(P)H-hydrate epimerase [Planctomycetes bacterium]|nr:NAD(P)H-hydrate epimerase [Planctomycetota bacterium]
MGNRLTREQVRRVDRIATERYGIPGIVLMENAGCNATRIIRAAYPSTRSALVVCGTGNNGGDGCVIARHLCNARWSVRLLVVGDRSRMTPDTAVNFGIIEKMPLERHVVADEGEQVAIIATSSPDELLVDAVLGTGFTGDVRESTASLIDAINAAKKTATVAIDVPSGLDCDTGKPSNATVRADLTITFVAAKVGFSSPAAKAYVGKVEVADIGAPREIVEEVLCDG